MTAKSRRALLTGAAATLVVPSAFPAIAPGIARAQSTWPTRPIRCIVALPPGGGTDAIARRAMQRLSEVLGVPVVVDNKPGAGGTIGSEVLAQAAPDGYTIGIATASSHAAAPVFRKDLPYDPVKSFTAITLLGTTPYILIGGPAADARDLAGFIAAAKAKPGKVACASLELQKREAERPGGRGQQDRHRLDPVVRAAALSDGEGPADEPGAVGPAEDAGRGSRRVHGGVACGAGG